MRLQPNRTGLLVGTLGLAIGVLSMGCSKAPPDDGANAKVERTENLRGIRYGEVFLITGNPLTHNLEASVYNTTGLNNQDDPRDTCPSALWARGRRRGGEKALQRSRRFQKWSTGLDNRLGRTTGGNGARF